MRPHGQILTAGVLLATSLVLFETTPLDLLVQDLFFDRSTGTWLVDRDSPLPRWLFYEGPKVVLAGWLLCLALSLPHWCPTVSPRGRRRTCYVLLCLALIPATVSGLKDLTNVYYPYKVERYGGRLPYRKLVHSLRQGPGEPRSRGFPAGHASGGFALLCLAYAARTRRERWLGALAGLSAGWIAGLYQIAKGAHYLSHTVVTMLLAWIMAAALARAFRLAEPGSEAGGTEGAAQRLRRRCAVSGAPPPCRCRDGVDSPHLPACVFPAPGDPRDLAPSCRGTDRTPPYSRP
jgi:membrane-associated PAP2 superfamily phosphatase